MPRKSHSSHAICSVNPKSLLKTNVQLILSATSRKDRAASTKGKFVIEYMETNQTNGVNSSAAAYADTRCALVAVKDAYGNVLTHYPEALRTPLLSAADAGTNKLMAKMFFKALKQRNQVAFKEVFPEEQSVFRLRWRHRHGTMMMRRMSRSWCKTRMSRSWCKTKKSRWRMPPKR
jgi:hypothetical protein